MVNLGNNVTIASRSLDEIVGKYPEIEEAIQRQAFYQAIDAIADTSSLPSAVRISGVLCYVTYQALSADRTLEINIDPVAAAESQRIRQARALRACGQMRRVRIVSPKYFSKKGRDAAEAACASLISNYNLLEETFLKRYYQEHRRLFDNLDTLLRSYFEARGVSPFVYNSCRLSLTQLTDNKFSFTVGVRQAMFCLEKFKLIKQSRHSPIALLITLLTNSGPDSFMRRGQVSSSSFLFLTFSDISTEEGQNFDLVNVESILTCEESLASLEVCRVGAYSLQANVASQFIGLVQPVLIESRSVIAAQLQTNLAGRWKRLRELALLWAANPANKGKLMAAVVQKVVIDPLAQSIGTKLFGF